MKIEKVSVGYLKTNCYVLGKDDEVLVIDPGDEGEKIIELINGRRVVGIIITHHHFDHIGALEFVKEKTGAQVYDISSLKEGKNKIGSFEFSCLLTKGHKEDEISLYFEKDNALFCGDFIFKDSIGRWDLPGGSIEDMKKSIEFILSFPLDMQIYPGHGEPTTLKAEKDNLENYIKYF